MRTYNNKKISSRNLFEIWGDIFHFSMLTLEPNAIICSTVKEIQFLHGRKFSACTIVVII